MDFSRIVRGSLPTVVANGSHGTNTSTEKAGLPDDLLLDTLSPLLGLQFNPLVKLFIILYNLVGSRLGIDPTHILTVAGLFWAANKLVMQLYAAVYGLARRHFTASIEISNSDDIYFHMMKWLASQPEMVNSRFLTAETASKGAWEDKDESELASSLPSPSAAGPGAFLNFSSQEAQAPPRFTPALGMHSFWFRGRYFQLQRKQEPLFDPSAGAHGMPPFKDKESLVLSCFGRSPEPIKALLQHAKEQYYLDHQAKTIVRRPAPQAMRRYGHRHSWQQVANRPVRPMRTVVLDDEQKIRVLSDMNEYLHPATPRWYANRGIPLRRGYLFHGPPGTGKTSLSFALAGVFGLDIYVISLLDPTLTEEDLLGLFTSLPRRCVVLLEDIDTAGLKRADDPAPSPSSSSDDEKEKKSAGKKAKNHSSRRDWKVSDLARELKRAGSGGDSGEKKGISLSGLLNAIDGVASHEGRVLIMTTNKPEALDEALIRPGRVDLQIAFTNASREQARELFVRMYEPEDARGDASSFPISVADHVSSSPPTPCTNPPLPDLPPTPLSLSSDRDGSMTDVSGITEIGDDDDDDDDDAAAAKEKEKAEAIPEQQRGHRHHQRPRRRRHEEDEKDEEKEEVEAEQGPKTKTRTRTRTRTAPPPPPLRADELARLAAQFAARIPPGQFSPAELQGFLLKRKKAPRRALAEVDAWVAGMLAQKAGKTRVLSLAVQ
ncbi:hypothetical protein VTH06DRAFT_6562 [Thermothelomyces fergusii]